MLIDNTTTTETMQEDPQQALIAPAFKKSHHRRCHPVLRR